MTHFSPDFSESIRDEQIARNIARNRALGLDSGGQRLYCIPRHDASTELRDDERTARQIGDGDAL